MLYRLLFLVLMSSSCLNAQEHFLKPYIGTYEGVLFMTQASGREDSIPFQLVISPSDQPERMHTTMSYLPTNGDVIDKKYDLVLDTTVRHFHQYINDENNGILLRENRINNRFYSLYEVENQLYHVTTTYSYNSIVFDLVVYPKQGVLNSAAIEEGVTYEVQAYPFMVSQYGVLKRKK